MSTSNNSKETEGATVEVRRPHRNELVSNMPRVEFWQKDGLWHYVEPSGKWSAIGYDSDVEATRASVGQTGKI